MLIFKRLALAITLGSGGVTASGAFATCADLALVLAIDASGSIDARDFALQQAGYAAAFADREVLAALAGAGVVDVAVVLWGDAEIAPQVLPWQRLETPEDAAGLSADLVRMPRRVTGDTGIGVGLWTALDLHEAGAACAARRVINVSGDGKESHGPNPRRHVALTVARERAARMGVTINGLAITVDVADLEGWYRDRVILGPDAFVMTATSFDAFGAAIIRKLTREIALPMLAAAEVEQRGRP